MFYKASYNNSITSLKARYLSIAIVTLIAFALRFTLLTEFPLGTNGDEAAKAYNAYSLLETGRTFRGLRWPFYFNDFSVAQPSHAILYNYLVIPSTAIFGVGLFAARLPAALLGTATVPIIYFLVIELFGDTKHPSKTNPTKIALVAAILLATAPWHILLSRIGIEPVSYIFLYMLGWYFYMKSRYRPGFIISSFTTFALTLYSYQSALITIPAFIAIYTIIDRKYWLQQWKLYTVATISFLSICSPIVVILLTNTRIFGHLKWDQAQNVADILINFPGQIISLVLYYPISVFLLSVTGFILMIKNRETKILIPMVLNIIAGLTPAAFTRIQYIAHYSRTSVIIGFVSILGAYAICNIDLKKFRTAIVLASIEIMASTITILIFVSNFSDLSFAYGFKELAQYLSKQQSQYDNIYVISRNYQPFIYIAMYLKYSPKSFLEGPLKIKLQDQQAHTFDYFDRFGKYYFCSHTLCTQLEGKTLYVVDNFYDTYYDIEDAHTVKYHGNKVFITGTNLEYAKR